MKYLLAFLLTLPFVAFSQDSIQLLPIKNVDKFKVDQYGNIYTLKFNQVKKSDKNLKEIFAYSDPLLGIPTDIVVTDPLNIVVLYKDQATAIFLDNRLSESKRVNFNDYKLYDVQMLGISDEHFLWVYDQATDKLYRLDVENQNISNRTLSLTQLVEQDNIPLQILTTFDKVYLNIPNTGILVFDATGSYQKTYKITDIQYFTIIANTLIFCKNGALQSIDMKNGKETILYKLSDQVDELTISDQYIYTLYKGNIKRILR